MAENDTPSLGGFEAFSSILTPGLESEGGRNEVINEPPLVDPDIVKKTFTEDDEETNDDNNNLSPGDDDDSGDDSKGDVADDSKGSVVSDNSDEGDSGSDFSEFEPEITALVNEKLSEALNWDITGEDAPKNIEEIVDFMKELVAEASVPSYANEEVRKLDDYVKNGGDIKRYYDTLVSGKVNVDTVNLENEYDQRSVVKEHLSNQGYSETMINRKLKNYEDAGVLDSEAEDALELLKEYNKKEEQKLLENAKKDAERLKQEQQNFITTVQESIKALDTIGEFKLTPKEKEELERYILVPGRDGMTELQRESSSDISTLLETAYFLKNRKALLSNAKKQGESTAVKNLHEKLKANRGNTSRSSGSTPAESASSGLSLLSGMITGK